MPRNVIPQLVYVAGHLKDVNQALDNIASVYPPPRK
jgi:hypothetical protein